MVGGIGMSNLWVMAGVREHWMPGDRAHFEYHCNESHDSPDAQAWYHSHRPVTVVEHASDYGPDDPNDPWSKMTYDDRAEAGMPKVYHVRHEDGFEHHAFEDELVDGPEDYYRPDPPSRTP